MGRSNGPSWAPGTPSTASSGSSRSPPEAVASGRTAPQLAGDLARQALLLCLAEIESVRTGRVVELA